jgi:hypothetical protein
MQIAQRHSCGALERAGRRSAPVRRVRVGGGALRCVAQHTVGDASASDAAAAGGSSRRSALVGAAAVALGLAAAAGPAAARTAPTNKEVDAAESPFIQGAWRSCLVADKS